ncbi:hypothetical protein Fot_36916 [Forsythia ovata]|uniref:Exopolyphosphatase n=1 Tax=Forsythia ovata TaxID=205694 RepID=A0ABD1SRV1_9LAMI
MRDDDDFVPKWFFKEIGFPDVFERLGQWSFPEFSSISKEVVRGIMLSQNSPTIYDRHVHLLTITITGINIFDLQNNQFYSLEIGLGGGRESRLNNIHSKPGKLAGDAKLLIGGHGGAGRLFTITHYGVEEVKNMVGDILRPVAAEETVEDKGISII